MARPKKKSSDEPVVEKQKCKSLFDHLKQVTTYQNEDYWSTLNDADKKTWSSYMINRFLSMTPEYTETVNDVQHLAALLSNEHYYRVLIAVIPQRPVFSPYIKGKKEKYPADVLKFLATHYGCSTREIRDVLPLLSTDDIRFIYRKYGIEVKEKELTHES
jgi:hypothetical protein